MTEIGINVNKRDFSSTLYVELSYYESRWDFNFLSVRRFYFRRRVSQTESTAFSPTRKIRSEIILNAFTLLTKDSFT